MKNKKLKSLNYQCFFVALILSTTFFSCKKCYDCETTIVTTYSPSSALLNSTSTKVTNEFCGTKKEKDEYVKNQSNTTTSTSGGIKVTAKATAICK